MRTQRSGAGEDHFADGIDVTEHEMSAEARTESDGAFEVDAITGAQRTEVGA